MAANDPTKNRTQNADDLLLWRDIREAVAQVNANHQLDLEIERGDKHAHINMRRDKTRQFIAVHVWEIEVKPPTLIVPAGKVK